MKPLDSLTQNERAKVFGIYLDSNYEGAFEQWYADQLAKFQMIVE